MRELNTATESKHKEPCFCPLFDKGLPDCYCVNITSAKIPDVLKYCMRAHESCPKYQRYYDKHNLERIMK